MFPFYYHWEHSKLFACFFFFSLGVKNEYLSEMVTDKNVDYASNVY